MKSRVISNIFVGIAAGVIGLSAFQGVLWWMLMSAVTSALIGLRITILGFDTSGKSRFFVDIIEAASLGMFGNIMTYMIFWILFYNIVHVV